MLLSGWITSVRALWVDAYGRANIPGCGGMVYLVSAW
jgi:hypothetical protein